MLSQSHLSHTHSSPDGINIIPRAPLQGHPPQHRHFADPSIPSHITYAYIFFFNVMDCIVFFTFLFVGRVCFVYVTGPVFLLYIWPGSLAADAAGSSSNSKAKQSKSKQIEVRLASLLYIWPGSCLLLARVLFTFSRTAFRYRVLIGKKRDRTTTGVPRCDPAAMRRVVSPPGTSDFA